MTAPDVTALVLCGGASRRMGGGDKTAALLGELSLLDHVLAPLPPEWLVVCVGPERPTRRAVTWTREEPPAGGPLDAVATGVRLVRAQGARRASTVVVLAGDAPGSGRAATMLVGALVAAPSGLDGVCAVDEGGRRQPLLGAYRLGSLLSAVESSTRDASAQRLVEALRVTTLPLPAAMTGDIDTPDDLASARRDISD